MDQLPRSRFIRLGLVLATIFTLTVVIALSLPTSISTYTLAEKVNVSNQDNFADYPQQLQMGRGETMAVYRLRAGYYAVHYAQAGAERPGSVLQLNDGAIAVFAGSPDAAQTTGTIGPVYELPTSGAIAVPTGMILIQFSPETTLESKRPAIQQAGYDIAETLSYAPHAGWVRSRSGNIADALQDIARLQAIPGVTELEPQLLMERIPRSIGSQGVTDN